MSLKQVSRCLKAAELYTGWWMFHWLIINVTINHRWYCLTAARDFWIPEIHLYVDVIYVTFQTSCRCARWWWSYSRSVRKVWEMIGLGNAKCIDRHDDRVPSVLCQQWTAAASRRKQRNFAVPGDFSGRRSVNTNQQKLSSNYYLPHTFPLDVTITTHPTRRSFAPLLPSNFLTQWSTVSLAFSRQAYTSPL